MLTKLIPSDFCSKCKWCCVFSDDDKWEYPFDEKTFIKKEDTYLCSCLTKNGCNLTRNKMPMDCRVYPFRVVKKDGKKFIAVAIECKFICETSREILLKFLENGFSEVLKSLSESGEINVADKKENYEILKEV